MEDGVLQVPVLEICKAVFAIGYRGWVSLETFHAELYDQSPSFVLLFSSDQMQSYTHSSGTKGSYGTG